MSRIIMLAWNKQALVEWIESEAQQKDYREIENQLGLGYGKIDWWRTGMINQLSRQDIQAIAQYRQWTEERVREWLGLVVPQETRLSA